jgi:hypothetical protein
VRLPRRDAWKTGRDIAIGVGLAGVVLAGALVVSGHVPPRGKATGNIHTVGGIYGEGLVPNARIVFQRVSDSMDIHVLADASGQYSVTLAPGNYLVLDDAARPYVYWYVRGLSPGSDGYRADYGTGAPKVTVEAGAQLSADFTFVSMAQCLAASDRIATPAGPVPVTQLRQGTLVWTLDGTGRRIAAPVMLLSHTLAPPGHVVLRLLLSDGRVVEASAAHPTADGRHVGELRPGDLLDGGTVSAVRRVPYGGDTWDLLPAGPTGVYWANDILLGSTLSVYTSANPATK